MRSRVNTTKHYTQQTSFGIGSGVVTDFPLVTAIAQGAAVANTFDVFEGSVITAIYLEFWIDGVTASKTAIWIVSKRSSDTTTPSATDMANLGAYDNKKNILNSGQGLPPSGGNVMAIYKGWLKIPKGKQRFGLGDKLSLTVHSIGTTTNICGLSTFKDQH